MKLQQRKFFPVAKGRESHAVAQAVIVSSHFVL